MIWDALRPRDVTVMIGLYNGFLSQGNKSLITWTIVDYNQKDLEERIIAVTAKTFSVKNKKYI